VLPTKAIQANGTNFTSYLTVLKPIII